MGKVKTTARGLFFRYNFSLSVKRKNCLLAYLTPRSVVDELYIYCILM